MNQAQRDGSIAEKSQAAAQKRLEAVGVELAAAKRGVFVGIGSNDRPRYMLRGLLRTWCWPQSLFAEVGAFA